MRTIKDVLELTQEEYDNLDTNKKELWVNPESGGEYRLIGRGYIYDIYKEEVIDLIEDCYNMNVPSFVEIDWDSTVENCLVDGYGQHFSSYDGSEEYAEDYYIFRIN